jgi:hypothetical protein
MFAASALEHRNHIARLPRHRAKPSRRSRPDDTRADSIRFALFIRDEPMTAMLMFRRGSEHLPSERQTMAARSLHIKPLQQQ